MTRRDEVPILQLRLEACGSAIALLRAQPQSPVRHQLIGRLERDRVQLLATLRDRPSSEREPLSGQDTGR